MATGQTNISKVSVINDFNSFIKTPAYNTCVYWNGYYPSYMNAAVLGGRNVTTPTASNLTETITAAGIINVCKTYVRYTTVYRRVRWGLITSSGTVSGGTAVCRTTDAYAINYTYGNGNMTAGGNIVASDLNSFYSAIRATAANAQTTAGVIDARVCHSSCHSNCHGSRGRR